MRAAATRVRTATPRNGSNNHDDWGNSNDDALTWGVAMNGGPLTERERCGVLGSHCLLSLQVPLFLPSSLTMLHAGDDDDRLLMLLASRIIFQARCSDELKCKDTCSSGLR
jgi:hypothetical protein